MLDELVPRETGREARISKRRGVNESRRERSVSPGLSERDLMGNNQDAFKQYITRRREARERHRSGSFLYTKLTFSNRFIRFAVSQILHAKQSGNNGKITDVAIFAITSFFILLFPILR